MGRAVMGSFKPRGEDAAATRRSQRERARAVEERGGSRPPWEVGGGSRLQRLRRSLPQLGVARFGPLRSIFPLLGSGMTRGKQKIEAQKRAAERNEKPKGSQIDARSAGLKTVCSICKAPLANHKQLVDHFGSKHPKEEVPPAPSS